MAEYWSYRMVFFKFKNLPKLIRFSFVVVRKNMMWDNEPRLIMRQWNLDHSVFCYRIDHDMHRQYGLLKDYNWKIWVSKLLLTALKWRRSRYNFSWILVKVRILRCCMYCQARNKHASSQCTTAPTKNANITSLINWVFVLISKTSFILDG